jgi:hypothetical protein
LTVISHRNMYIDSKSRCGYIEIVVGADTWNGAL